MSKKKILIIVSVAILVLVLLVAGVFMFKKEEKIDTKSDALKIKEEYESLNGEKAANGSVYPEVTLKENNNFRYASSKEVVNTLKNGTGLIYLGFKECPWCRNVINVLQYVNNDKILYLDMKEERDLFELQYGKAVKTKEGTNEYKEMLSILDSILEDYELKDENNNVIKTGEKRIYVPLVVGVLDGKIVGYHSGTVDLKEGQTPFDLLDNKQQSELKNIFDGLNAKVSGESCGMEAEPGC